MERTVTTSILAVCVVFTALITTLIFMLITCFTMRMKRFDILYQIERDQTQAKIREFDMQELETKGTVRRAKAAGYAETDVEALAPYYKIDLRGNLDKKVKADQAEAERKASNRKSAWFGGKTIADVASRGAHMTNDERIKQQLEAHRQLQDEQLQASYARFNSGLNSGNKSGGMVSGEMRTQMAEFQFFQNTDEDSILPLPLRSAKTSPVPSALGSPNSVSGRPMALNRQASWGRRLEEPAPFTPTEAPRTPNWGRERPGTSGTMGREQAYVTPTDTRPRTPNWGGRPGTSGTLGSMQSGERSPPPAGLGNVYGYGNSDGREHFGGYTPGSYI
jgi:hypothetical protein